ncbi:effector-associated domain EAD1-containing protein, partial [Nostoc sp. CALU 546]|uniref:effector-associated domain EAD1-containing protein n=1 Tax=Nostoc sp. CALU 546 TaxID=1867241 RepID=UPI003B678E59
MLSDEQRRRLKQEKNFFEQSYELQSEKIARLRNALVIETDPSRKFQYEQQIKNEETELKRLTDRLDEIEEQLQSAQSIPAISEPKSIQQKNMIINGQQKRKLQEALINALPNTESLEQMLLFQLDKNLITIAGEGSLQDIVFELIQTANCQGWIEDLVLGAYETNSGNSQLKEIFKELQEKFPRFNHDYYYKQGLSRHFLGDYQGAIEDYNLAIKLNPNDADYYYRRGISRNWLTNYQGAIEDFNQAIKLNPNDANYYYNRGISR